MTILRIIPLFVLTAGIAMLMPQAARAELSVCNDTGVDRAVAIGYKGESEWTSEGWWNIAPGDCTIVIGGDLPRRYYYYRTTTDGAFEGEGFRFCTDTNAFTIVGDDQCAERGYRREDFSQLDIGEATSFTLTLVGGEQEAPKEAAASTPSAASSETWGQILYEIADLPPAVAAFGRDVLACNMVDAVPSFGAQAFGLRDGREAYIVPCQLGDVNIEHYVAMTDPGGGYKLYEFELPPGDNQPNNPTIISPTFDPETLTLTGTTYYGPNSDCGLYEVHEYIADGDFFELLEQREKPNCDGQFQMGTEFPLRWTIEEMGG